MRKLTMVLLPCLLTAGVAGCGSTAGEPGDPTPAATAAAGCAAVSAPAAKDPSVSQPSTALEPGTTYTVRLETSCGRIEIELDQADNPLTAASFAHLVTEKYYDGLSFHRVVPGFVIQGGDPLGNGTGGPSWKVTEAPPADTGYTAGVVAMAKGGDEAPGTSGSQFFIVTADDAGLPADYAVAGRVTSGMDVAHLIEQQADAGTDGPPKQPVVITTATLQETAGG